MSVSPRSQRCKQNLVSTSQTHDYGAFVSFHWLSFPPSLKHQHLKPWRYPWRLRWPMRGMLWKKGGCGALGRTPRSGLFVDDRRARGGERGGHGRVIAVVLLSKTLFQTSSGASHFSFQVRWVWTFLFPLSAQLRSRKNMRIVVLKVLSIWLMWLLLASSAQVELSVLSFSSFPPDSVHHPGFWNISCAFILYHRKEFQLFRCLQLSRILGMPSENSTRLLVACVVGLLADGCKRSLHCARRAARCGCGSLVARGSFETCSPRSSGIGTLGSLPMRWCCAACGPCRESGEWRYGSRLKISTRSVSHFSGHGRFEREFHKEIVPSRPTDRPTDPPTNRPTDQPTNRPTDQPTDRPTDQPTHRPNNRPTDQPTKQPNILTTKKKRRRNRQRNKRRKRTKKRTKKLIKKCTKKRTMKRTMKRTNHRT